MKTHRRSTGTSVLLTCLLAAVTIAALIFVSQLQPAPSSAQLYREHYGTARLPFRSISKTGGESLVRLTDDGESTPVAWTDDGKSVLVRRPGRDVGQQQLSELWAISLHGKYGRRLSENAFLPTTRGTRVAFLRFVGQGQWDAVVLDLAKDELVQMGTASWKMQPAWVGKALVYFNQMSSQLIASAPEGNGLRPQVAGHSLPTDAVQAQVSSSGQRLAATDGSRLWIAAEGGYKVVTEVDQVWGFAWSPAGDQLAYVASNDGPAPELRVWDAEADASWTLVKGDLEHFGEPVWSPDSRRIAFTRRPTGNGLNTSRDIWVAEMGPANSWQGRHLRPLIQTAADEGSPRWAADGRRMAFALNGDVWVIDLRAPDMQSALATASAESTGAGMAGPDLAHLAETSSDLASQSLTAPTTIRVKHDRARNTCRPYVPDGWVDVYDFEEYVKRVVPHEVYISWPAEALKAQAVAARTYAWRKILSRRAPNYDPGFDVWDSTSDQYMCDRTYPSTNVAVDETRGQYIASDGNVIYAFFCAETGTPTNYRPFQLPSVLYLRSIDDPVSFGRARRGHSWGMSQWGAYRWAAWYGWEYQQILAHYYTSASVERSNTFAQPLASLTLPWSNFDRNTDYIYLQANATDNGDAGTTGVVRVTFGARGAGVGNGEAWTTLHTDTDPSDGWGTVWPVLTLADTLNAALELQVTAHDSEGQSVASRVSYIGLDRATPTGTLAITPTAVTTIQLSLALTASDGPRTGDPVRVSLGIDDWTWEDQALYKLGGQTVTDIAASDDSAWLAGAGTPAVLFGPYTADLPPGMHYRAYFWLKVPSSALPNSFELAKLDVVRDQGTELLGVRYVRGTDFKAGDTYQPFAVDFEYPDDGGEVEFRTDSSGAVDLWVDRVSIAYRPREVTPQMGLSLPAREGETVVRGWFVDRAENVSESAPVTVTVTDRDPPQGWRDFHCGRLTCTIEVRDVIAGLDVDHAAYRYSLDDGISWSDWFPASSTGANGSHAWERIVAEGIPAEDLPYLRRMQFRAYDVATEPNEGQSQAYILYHAFVPLARRD